MRTYVAIAITTALLLTLGAGGDDGTAAPPVDYTPLLTTLTNGVALPATQAFASDCAALDSALSALEISPSATTLTAAQAAWRTARADLRKLDALHFGPIVDDGISARIDVAPADDNGIEAVISGGATLDGTLVGTLAGASKGFLGVEYLIFSADGNDAVLAKLTDPTTGGRRCTFARAMGDEIVASAAQLDNDWEPGKGGYATQVLTAGAGSTRYPRQRGALDDFVGGCGYALEEIVGIRLGTALGHKGNGTPQPSLDPTPASDSAVADMTASLAGVTALYAGNGFHATVVADSMALDQQATAEQSDCAAKIKAIPAPFVSSLVNATPVVTAAYSSCDAFKTSWNSDLTSALGATLLPSDNDGD